MTDTHDFPTGFAGQCRFLLGISLWLVAFVPCWLITEGVGKVVAFVMDQSPSGY